MVLVEEQYGEARYRLLETVRQYTHERLEESEEGEVVRRRHAEHYLALAEEAEPKLKGLEQEAWLDRLELEHDNLRAALSWSLESGEGELGLRLGGALGKFWHMRGHLSEGKRWLQTALANATEETESVRVKALARAGWIAREQGDYGRSVRLTEEGLALAGKRGDRAGAATALYTLGWAALFEDELERAETLTEEALRLQHDIDDRVGVVRSLTVLGFVANVRREYDRAMALHKESLALAQEAEDGFAAVLSLGAGATASLGLGDYRLTIALCEEGIKLAQRLGVKHLIAGYLHVTASLAGLQERPTRAARLWGAAESLLEAIGSALTTVECRFYEPYVAAARAGLDEELWTAAWDEGRAMTLDQAIEYALEMEEPASHSPSASPYPGRLRAREAEVLRLVAKGLTNARIAEEFYISPRTVERHLHSIFRKLGVDSRVAAARFATENDLT